MDHLIRGVGRNASVRVAAVMATGVAAEAAQRHRFSPSAAWAVGRALTSGLLLATLTKHGERVTVQLVGDGPIRSITVDASVEDIWGIVRGYAARPDIGPPQNPLPVPATLGRRGVVNVLRDLGLRERYQGQIELTTGEIDEDLEAYLRTSEQVPSALGCEVILAGDGKVRAAGGILVQSLPGGDGETVLEVQRALRQGTLHRLLQSGVTSPLELAKQVIDDFEVLGEDRPVKFQCRCSQDRISSMLSLLGTVDLDEMIADNKPAEITCNFCNTTYLVERPELERIRAQISPRQSN
jgi:molecular chaperone Hsp33